MFNITELYNLIENSPVRMKDIIENSPVTMSNITEYVPSEAVTPILFIAALSVAGIAACSFSRKNSHHVNAYDEWKKYFSFKTNKKTTAVSPTITVTPPAAPAASKKSVSFADEYQDAEPLLNANDGNAIVEQEKERAATRAVYFRNIQGLLRVFKTNNVSDRVAYMGVHLMGNDGKSTKENDLKWINASNGQINMFTNENGQKCILQSDDTIITVDELMAHSALERQKDHAIEDQLRELLEMPRRLVTTYK